MKKVFRILAVLVAILALGVAGVISYVAFALPDVGEAPALEVEVTPERVAHGQYLANAVLVCMDCHSTRDWTKFSGPIKPGTEGMGGGDSIRPWAFPARSTPGTSRPRGFRDIPMASCTVL